MSKTAYLFPGQGSQEVGMGRALYEQLPEARARLDRADELLGFALTDLMFGEGSSDDEDEEEALKQTDVTQPALFAHSLAVMAVLDAQDARPAPDMTAGHSLGEYSALAAAGALSFEDGLRVVRRRGQLMAAAGSSSDEGGDDGGARAGTMAAVIGMENDALAAVCEDVTREGGSGDGGYVVQPANFNAPGQVVISGDVEAVEATMRLCEERGARRAIRLPVSGAFHSPLMQDARDGLAEVLADLEIRAPRCPVYLNVTAEATTEPEAIRAALLEQLLSPVRWAASLQAMHESGGAERFVEIGAGRVLSGLVRRTLGRDVAVAQVGTADDLAGAQGA
ncbi:MAG: [acyl-carrier-protein] S-malonyltransferase [Bacteroidetes bacterium QS_8_68_15]|nr:MAG: [acyl-carrier-protein] S-malonyltransferase [Bacteroidetes bacterium QS_8_68_15]